MTEPAREDWPRLIAELEAAGITLHAQSKMIPCQFIQLQRLKAGAEPKYFIGDRLKQMHRDLVPHETLRT